MSLDVIVEALHYFAFVGDPTSTSCIGHWLHTDANVRGLEIY